MKIELPATLTARYDPDPWTEEDYETGGSGVVSIQFGGFDVMEIRIEANGERFSNQNNSYRSAEHADDELALFVAEWLKKVFENALSIK